PCIPSRRFHPRSIPCLSAPLATEIGRQRWRSGRRRGGSRRRDACGPLRAALLHVRGQHGGTRSFISRFPTRRAIELIWSATAGCRHASNRRLRVVMTSRGHPASQLVCANAETDLAFLLLCVFDGRLRPQPDYSHWRKSSGTLLAARTSFTGHNRPV